MPPDPVFDRISPTLAPQEAHIMYQDWSYLLFLHWAVPVADLQKLLPPGLTIDTFEGVAYIGLVPFTMSGIRPVGMPTVPGLSAFHEINVRTYVHVNGKEPGVWFFSLDAAQPIAVQLARTLFRLPYYFARMAMNLNPDGTISYLSERQWPEPTPSRTELRYRPMGTPAASNPGTLEFFLAERYVLYAEEGGRLYRGRVHHTPYPLQSAELLEFYDTLVAKAGIIPSKESPTLVHYAAGVSTKIYSLHPVANGDKS